MTSQTTSKLSPLERYIRILELLAAFPEGLGLTEIARILALPKGSVHRLLGTLHESHLIELLTTGGYTLSARVRRLANPDAANKEWIEIVLRPHLVDLTAEIHETCYLAKLQGGHRVQSILMEAPEIRWRGFILPGKNMAPHAAASAKAILAFQSDTVIEAALAEELPQFTSNTTTKRTQILQDYDRVRQQGYATCIGEIDELLAAVAVPIRIPHLGVIYSLGLTGPLKRLVSKDLKLLANIMTIYAERIAESLATGLGCRGTLD